MTQDYKLALITINAIGWVLKTILAPEAPLLCVISTKGKFLLLHSLIEQLYTVFFALTPSVNDRKGFCLLRGVPIYKHANKDQNKDIGFHQSLLSIVNENTQSIEERCA